MDLKSIFLKNWQAKLICILLAFGLWFYVANEGFQVKQIADAIPLRTINLNERLAVVEDLDHVRISIRPSQGLQQSFGAEKFDAYLDLQGLGKGTYELPVKIVAADTTVQVLRVEPATVQVTLDDRVEDYFSVVPKIVGEPGAGYTLGESQLEVDRVLVGGAETVVGSIRSIVAEVDVGGEQSEIKKTVELKAVNEVGETIKNIYIEPKTIDVTVPIMQSADVRTVGVKIQTSGSPAAGYFVKNLVADPSTVILRGSREKLQAIEYIETEPVSLSGLTATVEREVKLVLPEDIESEGSDTVKVKVELDGNQVSQSVRGIFEFKNLAGGRSLESFSPANVLVTVSGSADKISALTETDVRVIVDLAGKGSGTYTVNLVSGNVRVPDQVNVVSLETKQIEVTIK